MRLCISDEDPYVKYEDSDEDDVNISIMPDDYKDDDDEYDELSNMGVEKLKKVILGGDKKKLKKIKKFLKKNNKVRSIQGGDKELKLSKGSLQVIPRKDLGREIVYVFGPSGSGKSVFSRKYAEEYKKLNPDNPVYVFSRLMHDESLDDMKPIRIIMDEETLEQLDIDNLEDSLCIFDDTDSISNKKLCKLIDALKDDIVQTGRHSNISCIITTHMACNYSKTRILLNETHKIVIFPQSGSSAQNRRLLEVYGGIEKKDISSILRLPSRWVVASLTAPKNIIHEKGIKLL